jgi:hypothetical protein
MSNNFEATGEYRLVFVAKDLPVIGFAFSHAYIALVRPDGSVSTEVHGRPFGDVFSSTSDGNHLMVTQLDPSGNLWRRRAERDSVRWRGQ